MREPRTLQCGARARVAAHGPLRPPALPRAMPIPSKAAPREPPDPSPPFPLPTLCATAWMHGNLHQPPAQCPEAPAPRRTVRARALKYIPPGPHRPHTYAHLPSTTSLPPVCHFPLLCLCVHVPQVTCVHLPHHTQRHTHAGALVRAHARRAAPRRRGGAPASPARARGSRGSPAPHPSHGSPPPWPRPPVVPVHDPNYAALPWSNSDLYWGLELSFGPLAAAFVVGAIFSYCSFRRDRKPTGLFDCVWLTLRPQGSILVPNFEHGYDE